jgi:serine/threonine protein kinase
MQLGRQVALRTLSRRHTENHELVKRFIDGAREVAALDHRNIVHVFELDNDTDRYYVVTEYIDGDDLNALGKKGGVDFADAVRMIYQASEGLQHAHSHKLVRIC